MRFFFAGSRKRLIATFFADRKLRRICDPLRDGVIVAADAKVSGVLIDTFRKTAGNGLLDLLSLSQIGSFAKLCKKKGLEAWVAGSVTEEQLRDLSSTGVDVVCVRGAACRGAERQGPVDRRIVVRLASAVWRP
jgi:hypothetical protein